MSAFACWYILLSFTGSDLFQWPWLYFEVPAMSNNFDLKIACSFLISKRTRIVGARCVQVQNWADRDAGADGSSPWQLAPCLRPRYQSDAHCGQVQHLPAAGEVGVLCCPWSVAWSCLGLLWRAWNSSVVLCVDACVCVCVSERERERDRERGLLRRVVIV